MFFLAVNFDHFQILRAIGKGSFGKVRTHTHTQQAVTLKWSCVPFSVSG